MAEAIPTGFDEFEVEPGVARRGDVLTVSGRVTAGGSAAGAGMVRVEVWAQGRPLPSGKSIKLVRTDFTDAGGWASLMRAIEREWYGSAADVEVVDDPEFSGLTAEELMGRLPGGSLPRMLVVADTRALATGGHELLGLDLRVEPGRPMRFTADVLVEVQVNLDLANMDFSDFADSAGPDGVHRGFD